MTGLGGEGLIPTGPVSCVFEGEKRVEDMTLCPQMSLPPSWDKTNTLECRF